MAISSTDDMYHPTIMIGCATENLMRLAMLSDNATLATKAHTNEIALTATTLQKVRISPSHIERIHEPFRIRDIEITTSTVRHHPPCLCKTANIKSTCHRPKRTSRQRVSCTRKPPSRFQRLLRVQGRRGSILSRCGTSLVV